MTSPTDSRTSVRLVVSPSTTARLEPSEEKTMKGKTVLLPAMLILGMAVGLLGSQVLGQSDSMEDPIAQEELARHELPTTEGDKLVTVRRVRLAPGATVSEDPTVEHPAQEFVYVLEGSAALTREGEETVDFSAGEAWHNDLEQPHTLANASESEPLDILNIWVGEEGAF